LTKSGSLYICGTPIGNLEDITLRVLRVLKEVDLIAAEDTRRTSRLLNYYQIKKPLKSYHEHNERECADKLLEEFKAGRDIALVSDAGMPGISDPGILIIRKAIKEGIPVIPVPGPTAAVSALVVSGISTERFVFEGFLPRKGKKRKERLQELRKEKRTTIFYESPQRIKQTLKELAEIIKGRKLALLRELTKVHEEKIYGSAREVLNQLVEREIKGELVVVLEGNKNYLEESGGWEEMELLEHLSLLIENGYSKKEAVKEVARLRKLPKSKVYKEAIKIDYIDSGYKV